MEQDGERAVGGGLSQLGLPLLSSHETVISRHEKVALSFSGGKDSLACVHLLMPLRDRITIYHLDTGDLLPEITEVVDHIRGLWPRFVDIKTDAAGWIAVHGLPTDLLPFSSHAIGQATRESDIRLSQRFDCCFANLMWPLYEKIKADGNTLVIRGSKSCDMRRLPANDGDNPDGVELFLPIKTWSNDDVFAYLHGLGISLPSLYSHVSNAPECARCSAWWSEKRASYLRERHPELFAEYIARLTIVAAEIERPLAHLRRELCEARAL